MSGSELHRAPSVPWQAAWMRDADSSPCIAPLDLSLDLDFAPWVLRSDPRMTEEVYARLDVSGSERCGCDACINFANVRHLAYPTDVIDLFEWLGIDPLLESEVVHRQRLTSGDHVYSGWFHLVGEIRSGPTSNQGTHGSIQSRHLVPAAEGVAIAFSADRRLAPDRFDGLPVVELEFALLAPWLCDVPEPA